MQSLRRCTVIFSVSFLAVIFAVSAIAWSDTVASKDPEPVPIWKGGAPGSDSAHWPRADYREEWEIPGEVLTGVTEPTVQVFLPQPSASTGVAVVICPGGGYRNLWIAKEGWKVARELQKRGIAGIVLKYRHYNQSAAVQDAHRAVRYVRSRAKEWGINEQKIGIGGFSAGGHLAINMAAQLGKAEDWTPDGVDGYSKRPDFLMLIYPSVRLSQDAIVDASFPPAFLAVASDDDRTPAPDLVRFFNQLQGLKVASELHIYQSGGHGFGTGTPECNCATWLDLFRNWIEVRGLAPRKQ